MVFGPCLVSVDGLLFPHDRGYSFHIALFFLLGFYFCRRVFDCQRGESTVDLHK